MRGFVRIMLQAVLVALLAVLVAGDVEVLRQSLASHGGHTHAIDALRQSLAAQGGHAHANLTIAQTMYGLGLLCTGHVSKEDIPLYIPSGVAPNSELARYLYPRTFSWGYSEMETTAAMLGYERFYNGTRRGRRTLWQFLTNDYSPNWRPWIAMLPKKTIRNAAVWREADVNLAVELFPETHLPNLRPAFYTEPPEGLSKAQWRWSLSIVSSRSFEDGIILPFVDFANHRPFNESDSAWVSLKVVFTAKTMKKAILGGRVAFRLSRDCEIGDQIFLDYGERGSLGMEAAFGARIGGPVMVKVPTNNGTVFLLDESNAKTIEAPKHDCLALLKRIRGKSAMFPETLSAAKELLEICAKL